MLVWERAAILQHGFAVVGLTALVDEATGHQDDRARDAVAKVAIGASIVPCWYC